MNTQISIGGRKEPLEFAETQRVVDRERAQDAEPDAVIKQPVGVGEAVGRRRGGCAARMRAAGDAAEPATGIPRIARASAAAVLARDGAGAGPGISHRISSR